MLTGNDHIGHRLIVATHLIQRRVDSFGSRYGLSGIQSRILSYLLCASEKGQDVYQRDIERVFGIRRSSVTSVITNLEQLGCLVRQPVAGDARLKKLVITEKGIDINMKVANEIMDFESSLRNCFSSGTPEEFARMLGELIQFLDDPNSRHGCCSKE